MGLAAVWKRVPRLCAGSIWRQRGAGLAGGGVWGPGKRAGMHGAAVNLDQGRRRGQYFSLSTQQSFSEYLLCSGPLRVLCQEAMVEWTWEK